MGCYHSRTYLIDIKNTACNLERANMNKNLKFIVYITSIAWLVYTLVSLSNTTEALTNGIITAVVSLVGVIVNDLNK
ncbi:MAG TPA: hypothetical protein VJI32_01790 [Candidatus Nanoarchaeia archaeon]|nr:hypothetical protein [Candidatus Nanoarchaeia archaeon]